MIFLFILNRKWCFCCFDRKNGRCKNVTTSFQKFCWVCLQHVLFTAETGENICLW